MKVIILNAGVGNRLQPLTNTVPKCLIEISKKVTILDYQLENILKCDLNDIIILTGPFEEKIKEHIKTHYPNLKIQYIHNPKFKNTNYIYSLYLTNGKINDDIILLHGDLIFSNLLLKNIIQSGFSNCVLVNKDIPPPKKDFKAQIIDEKIEKIGVDVFGTNSAFLAPLYKLSKEFFLIWLEQIKIFIQNNLVNCYAEDALNEILDKVVLKPFFFKKLICMEIDDFQDLNYIRNFFKQ